MNPMIDTHRTSSFRRKRNPGFEKTSSDSGEEAIANIKEAIEGYVMALQKDKLPVPEEHFDTLLVAE